MRRVRLVRKHGSTKTKVFILVWYLRPVYSQHVAGSAQISVGLEKGRKKDSRRSRLQELDLALEIALGIDRTGLVN
jgi:hypothetical protein